MQSFHPICRSFKAKGFRLPLRNPQLRRLTKSQYMGLLLNVKLPTHNMVYAPPQPPWGRPVLRPNQKLLLNWINKVNRKSRNKGRKN